MLSKIKNINKKELRKTTIITLISVIIFATFLIILMITPNKTASEKITFYILGGLFLLALIVVCFVTYTDEVAFIKALNEENVDIKSTGCIRKYYKFTRNVDKLIYYIDYKVNDKINSKGISEKIYDKIKENDVIYYIEYGKNKSKTRAYTKYELE